MRTLIVVESIWGNTEAIGRAIATGIGGDVEVLGTDAAPDRIPDDIDLVVVGGPTHAFAMSTPVTRKSAREQGAEHIPTRGIREWLDGLATPTQPPRVATFDTRTVSPRLPGSAAKKAIKHLVRRGMQPIAKPETFGVHGYSGPLADGETARAERWRRELARSMSRSSAG